MELFLKGIVTKEEAVVSVKHGRRRGLLGEKSVWIRDPLRLKRWFLFTLPETNP